VPQVKEYSEDTARSIDQAVREIVAHRFQAARAILQGQRTRLEAGASQLLEQETLTEVQLQQILAMVPADAAESLPVRA